MPRLQRVPEPHVQYAYGVYLLGHKHSVDKGAEKSAPTLHTRPPFLGLRISDDGLPGAQPNR